MLFLVNRMYTLKVSKEITNMAKLNLEEGRFQNSGQFGIYGPRSYENFALECNQPCDY